MRLIEAFRQMMTVVLSGRKKYVILFSILLMSYLLVRHFWSTGSNTEERPLTIKVARVRKAMVVPRISAPGTIEPFERIAIHARTPGKIEKILVNRGDLVQKGQTIAELEKLPLQLELQQNRAALTGSQAKLRLTEERYLTARRAVEKQLQEVELHRTNVRRMRAELDKARNTFKGKEKIHRAGGISREDFETARIELITVEAGFLTARNELRMREIGFRDEDLLKKGHALPGDPALRRKLLIDINTAEAASEVAVAAADVSSAQTAVQRSLTFLAEATIRSPESGLIAERHKSPGEEIRGGVATDDEAIAILVQIDQVYVSLHLKESQSRTIAVGMPVAFKVDVFGAAEFKAAVKHIDPVIDDRTHTVGVRALHMNEGLKLRPGMFARASIATGEAAELLLIPEKATLPGEGGKATVFIVRDNRSYPTVVVLGPKEGQEISVQSGIAAEDTVALDKFSVLREGTPVSPVLEQSPRESEPPQ